MTKRLRFKRTADDRGSAAGWNVYIGDQCVGWIKDDKANTSFVKHWQEATIIPDCSEQLDSY